MYTNDKKTKRKKKWEHPKPENVPKFHPSQPTKPNNDIYSLTQSH